MKTLQCTKKEAYQGEQIYIGIDVHKKNWSVCILGERLEHKTYSQPPEPEVLIHYLQRHFPEATYHSAYEAGFCGFWIDRALKRYGIDNIVVSPADIPTTDKEKKRKGDQRDARKIARELRKGDLVGVYVPEQSVLEDRLLLRTRQKLLSEIKRCKCRIKSQLNFFGISIPDTMDKPYWNKAFRQWLKSRLFEGTGQILLQTLLKELEDLESHKRTLEQQIIALAKGKYGALVTLLRSIPGIGILAAMTLITELVDIHRFKTVDHMHSFMGLVPNVYASGDTEHIGRITKRHNAYLRPVLLQAAWRAAKADPDLMRTYNKLCRKMKPHKAIIRITKKLSNRIRYVWKNQLAYQNL